MAKRKPEIGFDTRKALEARGVIERPEMPSPRMPKLDALIGQAVNRHLFVALNVGEDGEGGTIAGVTLGEAVGDQLWRGESEFPVVALAEALAAYVEEREPLRLRAAAD